MRVTLALLALAGALSAQSWCYYPINSVSLDTGRVYEGLMFYFSNPGADSALVTVDAISGGRQVTLTRRISTEYPPVFSMQIDPEERYQLLRITMQIGDRVYYWDKPVAGEIYEWGKRKGPTH